MSRLTELQNELEIVKAEENRVWDEIENAVADLPLCEQAWDMAARERWNMELHLLSSHHIRFNDQIIAEQIHEMRVAKHGTHLVAIVEKAASVWEWLRWKFA